MFWLHSSKIRMSEILPREFPTRGCTHFCCRGRECKRELDTTCPCLHPCSPCWDLKLERVKLIGNYFMAKNGWFNEYHSLKVSNLKPKYKALLGGKDGPTSKTAWPIFDIVVQHKISWPICLFIWLCCVPLIITSGPLFTSEADPTNSDVAQFCAEHWQKIA